MVVSSSEIEVRLYLYKVNYVEAVQESTLQDFSLGEIIYTLRFVEDRLNLEELVMYCLLQLNPLIIDFASILQRSEDQV